MAISEVSGCASIKEILEAQRIKLMRAFSMKSYDPDNTFNGVYGINGLYYSDIDEEVSAPFVVIESADLARLVAIKQRASNYIEVDEIEKLRIEVGKKYLRANGMDEKTIKFFDDLSNAE
jgi:hypothetical protein